MENKIVETNVVKGNKPVVAVYKSRSELSMDEIKSLPRVRVSVKKTVNKNYNSVRFEIKHFLTTNSIKMKGTNPELNSKGETISQIIEIPYKNQSQYFNLTKFELLKELNGFTDLDEYVWNVPFRAVKGFKDDGDLYFFYELFLAPGLVISDFYGNDEINLLSKRKGIKDIKFLMNDVVKSNDDLINSFEEIKLNVSEL